MAPRPSRPSRFAVRAAYFGERMCPFCDHRNPSGAKFCNDCGSPLHLKPCANCSAVSDEAANHCYQCGAGFAAVASTADADAYSPSVDHGAIEATACDVDPAAGAARRSFDRERVRMGWRLAAAMTILIGGVIMLGNLDREAPDRTGLSAGSLDTGVVVSDVSAMQGVPEAPAPRQAEPAAVAAPAPAPPVAVSDPPAFRQGEPQTAAAPALADPVAVRGPSRHESSYARPTRAWKAATEGRSASPHAAPSPHHVASMNMHETHATNHATPSSQAVQVSMSACSGDLISRIVCDQRVRQHICQGRWGEAQECKSGLPGDRGQ